MNELQVFNNPEFGTVRTILIEDQPWAVGKDIALALGYKDTISALKNHVDPEDKMGCPNATPSVKDSKGRTQHPVWINESGLYSLILSSKLPSAKRFKRWVTNEVLPAIRRNGCYTVGEELDVPALPNRQLTPDDYLNAAKIVSNCRNERLPYVLALFEQAGIDTDITTHRAKALTDAKNVVEARDPTCAVVMNQAMSDYGISLKALERITGIHNVQLARIRRGESIPKLERSRIIRAAIKQLAPDITDDQVYAGL